MAKNMHYSAPEKFDVSVWSQSEACRTRVREICSSFISEHDQLTNLSRQLFENGVFVERFKALTGHEIQANSNSRWMRRLGAVGWLVLGGLIAVIGEFILKVCSS